MFLSGRIVQIRIWVQICNVRIAAHIERVIDGEIVDIVRVGVKCEVNLLNHFLIQFLAKS